MIKNILSVVLYLTIIGSYDTPLCFLCVLGSYCDVSRGSRGVFRRRCVNYTPSHFYNKNLQPIIILDLIGFLMDKLSHLGVFYGTPELLLDGRHHPEASIRIR